MSVIIVVHIDTQDPKQLGPYQALARPTMEEHGIRLLAKSPAATVLEGEAPGAMTVVLEAESTEHAQAWYASPGYTEAIRAREGKAEFTMVVAPRV